MAVRTDVTVDYSITPYRVQVAKPSTTISIQDLYDTLATEQSKNVNFPIIAEASGKQSLGSGLSVGITLKLKNTIFSFEGRPAALRIATVTTGDANGITLIDSTATFQTLGVNPLTDSVVNATDGNSVANMRSVDSQTQITCYARLAGGTNNTFTVGDTYRIGRRVLTTVTGGNLVAVNASGGAMAEILPTALVTTSVEKSVSAALVSTGIKKNEKLDNFAFVLFTAGTSTPATGKTVTATRSIDGGAFAVAANATAEVGNGVYKINLAASDLNGQVITLRFVAAGVDDRLVTVVTSV